VQFIAYLAVNSNFDSEFQNNITYIITDEWAAGEEAALDVAEYKLELIFL
jgi:hypothetical protein